VVEPIMSDKEAGCTFMELPPGNVTQTEAAEPTNSAEDPR
jgi:hypothetical protein